MGRRRKSEEQKRLDWWEKRYRNASSSVKGTYVKFRLKVRGIDWKQLKREEFVGFCNCLKYNGKEVLEKQLYQSFGLPKYLLEYETLCAIEKPETTIHQCRPLDMLKPLRIKKLDAKALLDFVSKKLPEEGGSS